MTREEAIELLVNATYSEEWQGNEELTEANHIAIEALQTELVQCKDCKHYKKINPRAKSGMCYKDIVASA